MRENNSKNIEDLKKELYEMHKQFDSINIEKTLNNNPTEKTVKVDLKDIKDKKSKKKEQKITKNIETIPKRETTTPINVENINLDSKIKDVKPKIESKLKDSSSEPKKSIQKEDTSYLSIKEKLEKIKKEIIERDKLIAKKENEIAKQNISKLKKSETKTLIKEPTTNNATNQIDTELSATNSKSSLLTIIILVLIIITLISIYYIFFLTDKFSL